MTRHQRNEAHHPTCQWLLFTNRAKDATPQPFKGTRFDAIRKVLEVAEANTNPSQGDSVELEQTEANGHRISVVVFRVTFVMSGSVKRWVTA